MTVVARARQVIARVLDRLRGPRSHPYPQLVALAEAFGATGRPPDVLCLGDSVLERVSHHDTDRRTLGEMLAASVGPGRTLLPISGSGYHVEVYRALLRSMAALRHRPTTVLVTVNVRSCSPQWDLNPRFAFGEELRAVDAFVRDPSASVPRIREDAPVSRAALRHWSAATVDYPGSTFRTVGEFQSAIGDGGGDDPVRLRRIFEYHYMHRLVRTHRKLTGWSATFDLLRDLGVRCVAYVTPINVEGGTRLVGDAFAAAVRANVAVFAEAMSARAHERLRFLDLSELLGEGDFFRRHEATEHINADGRRKLAARLVEALDR